MQLAEYSPPAGYYDLPYCYVIGNELETLLPLTTDDGNTFIGLTKNVAKTEDFFILRRLELVNMFVGPKGQSNLDGGFNYRDALGHYAFSSRIPIFGGTSGDGGVAVLPICPEKVYPRSSNFLYDVDSITKLYNGMPGAAPVSTSVPTGQILLWGARRTRGADTQPRARNGRACEPYTYSTSINVNWNYYQSAGVPAPPQVFTIPVTGWDFELQNLSVVNDQPAAGASGSGGHTFYGTAQIKLFDYQQVPISDSHISLAAFNTLNQQSFSVRRGAVRFGVGSQVGTPQGLGAICPSLIYPDQSVIYFELKSLIAPADQASNTITLMFSGVRRFKRQ